MSPSAPPKPAPWEARCASCGGWVGTVPGISPWFRGRCGNRQVSGLPGRKCRLYGQSVTFKRPG